HAQRQHVVGGRRARAGALPRPADVGGPARSAVRSQSYPTGGERLQGISTKVAAGHRALHAARAHDLDHADAGHEPDAMKRVLQPEKHYSQRIGWLRAAVLGANDGIVSTASLLVGVAAAETPRSGILVAGVAGLVAGAMSMAAGEYVS